MCHAFGTCQICIQNSTFIRKIIQHEKRDYRKIRINWKKGIANYMSLNESLNIFTNEGIKIILSAFVL